MGEIFSGADLNTVIYDAANEKAIGGIAVLAAPDYSPHVLEFDSASSMSSELGDIKPKLSSTSHVLYWDPNIADMDILVEAILKKPRNEPVEEAFLDKQAFALGSEQYSWFQFYASPVDTFLARHGLTRDDLDPSVRALIEEKGVAFTAD